MQTKDDSKTVRKWIKEIKDLAHRSEDVIETHAFRVSLNRGWGLKQLLRILNKGYSIHQIGAEISEIKLEIARVAKSMQEYGIKSIIQGESSTANSNANHKWKRQTFPNFEIADCFVGKEDDLIHLVSLVIDNERAHRVIKVWGMGGIGKTTIVRKVYNHIDIKSTFDCFAWVCVTQQCQIRSVLEDVLKQLAPQRRGDISNLSNTELVTELCQIQKGKRCLVILDDLWEIDHWNSFKPAFLGEGSISKTLLTTRKQNVAEMGFAFEPGLLGINDGWHLLMKKAFPQNNIPDFPVEEKWLQDIGKEIVRKCGRLPLAICLIGGVLSKKKTVQDWEKVNANISAYLYRNEGIENKNEIAGVLNLSYEDLPYHLKPCFLYLGFLREDDRVGASFIYNLWIAEGMISCENQGYEETLVETAELYLSELVSRCLVQVEVGGDDHHQKYRFCSLHDVVRELCLSKGKEEDFYCKQIDYRGGNFNSLLNESLAGTRTHVLEINFAREVEVERNVQFTREDDIKHIRTFMCSGNGNRIEFPLDFGKFNLLRSLCFEGFNFAGRKLPRGITNLIHLRNLTMHECELDELPSSISNLTYLHTLNLNTSLNVRVPNVLKNMHRLRRLYLSPYDDDTLEIRNYRIELEGLDGLETLIGLNSMVHDLKSITRMKNLRALGVHVHDNESLSALIDDVKKDLKNLLFCTIVIRRGCDFTSTVFDCPHLHRLTISVPIRKLPVECETEIIISKLMHLTLSNSEIEDDPMEILGKLQFLEELDLLGRSFVGEEMKCHAMSFPRLKYLKLRSLPNLREWTVEQGAMPLLSEIEITDCPSLKTVPDGFRFINTLEQLEISGMPELAKRVLASPDGDGEGGEDFDKVCHVRSIIVT